MDYEFTLDAYSQPLALFSMGHEAIGRWFSEELGSNQEKMDKLLYMIDQLEQHQSISEQVFGLDAALMLNRHEIEITATVFDIDEEAPEGTTFYDDESGGGCGLEDFKQALLAWKNYTLNNT